MWSSRQNTIRWVLGLSQISLIVLLVGPPLDAQVGSIDTPTKMQVATGQFHAGGWGLDFNTGIQSIRIIVDGFSLGDADLGGYRPDVCSAIGNYPGCPYVGWNIVFDTTQFPDGPHNLNALITTSDGRQASFDKSFIIDNAGQGLTNATLYHLVNRGTGGGLDIANVDPSPGATLWEWSYHVGPNQVMQFYSNDDGFFEIQMLHSLKALSALNGSGNGAQISQATYTDIARQKWQLIYVGGGFYALINQASGRAMDLSAGSPANSTPIQLWDFLNNQNQQWQIVPEMTQPGGTLGWSGASDSTTYYSNLDIYDVAAPGVPSLSAPVGTARPPCLPDSRLYASTTAGQFPGGDGLVHLSYGFTDRSGLVGLVDQPGVQQAFDTGFSEWNGYSGTTGFQFAPVPSNAQPISMNIKIHVGTDYSEGGCSAAHLDSSIGYNYLFIYEAHIDPSGAAAIAAHEVGHLMGLGDLGTYVSDPPSIMNNSNKCVFPNLGQTTPTNYDATGARACSNRAQGLQQSDHTIGQSSAGYSSVIYNGCNFYVNTLDWFLDDSFVGSDPTLYSLSCNGQ